MSFDSMLIHRCDVYHLTNEPQPTKYGVPQQAKRSYAETPDLADVPCYWQEQSQTVAQGQPNKTITQVYLVIFPPTADVRVNDKVIFKGAEFTLQVPNDMRGHHWEVTAIREGNL